MCKLIYSTAAVAASPKDELLLAMPSNSVMTARGTRIVQQRLSTREAKKMDNEERSMLVLMTRTRREVSFDRLAWARSDEHARSIPVQSRVYSQSTRGGAIRVALTSAF